MSTKLPARLVRDVVQTDMYSNAPAVRHTETVDVMIIWPTGFPEQDLNHPYSFAGEWRIAEVRGAVIQSDEMEKRL